MSMKVPVNSLSTTINLFKACFNKSHDLYLKKYKTADEPFYSKSNEHVEWTGIS